MAEDNVLWVGGLVDEVTEDLLCELFLQVGPLDKVSRPKEKDGSLRKFAFVEFKHAESVPYAIQVMDGTKLFGQHLRLKGRTGSTQGGGITSAPASSSYPLHSHQILAPSSPSRSYSGSRTTPDYQRSRSYHGGEDSRRGHSTSSPHLSSHTSYPGHNHHRYPDSKKGTANGGSTGHGCIPFNGPAEPLSQSFSNMPAFAPSNMQPHSIDDRRNRLMQQQAISMHAHAQRMGNQQQGYNFNYAQSFAGYGYGQQMQHQQQWYPPNQ